VHTTYQALRQAAIISGVSDINNHVQTVNRELQFHLDNTLPLVRSIVTVIDANTREIIREFPIEPTLSFARSMNEQVSETVQRQLENLIISARA